MDQGDKPLEAKLETNGHEASVAWAAWRMRCTERTVLYYLKQTKLRGIKVGKSWFIDRASIEAHCAAYGIAEPPSPSSSHHPELSIQAAPVAEIQPQLAQGPPLSPVMADKEGAEVAWSAGEQQESITKLKVYVAFNEAMKLTDLALSADTTDVCRKRLRELQLNVMEAIGAGYYSNWAEKTNHYLNAKAQLGAMISLIYSCPHLAKEMSPYLRKVEQDIIPMLGALIGKLFKSRANYNRQKFGDGDGERYAGNKGRRWSK